MRMRARGFTLIELMVSIALFGLIASGAMMLVMSSLRMQAHSARVDVAQSAVRAGLDFMTRDLLSASSGAISGTIEIAGVPTPTLRLLVPSNTGTNGSDVLDLYMADPNYDFSTTYSVTTATSTNIDVDQSAQFLPPNQLAILSDLTNAVQMKITAIGAISGSPAKATLTVSGLNGGMPVASYPTQSFVFALRHVTYRISQPYGADPIYANQSYLTMDLWDGGTTNASNPQPLAEGVEDLQVAFGFDNNGDGTIDSWIFSHAGDTMPTSLAALQAVRITLVAKSTMAENGTFQPRPVIEDKAAVAADGFFRRLITTQVSVRNLNL